MHLIPLPALDEDPRDEQAITFQDALSSARLSDEQYLAAISELDPNADASLDEERRIERELRDRVREMLGMAPRQRKADVSLQQHALNNGIAPQWELPDPDNEHEDGRHGDDRIQNSLLPEDLERRLNALITKCKTWEQETGINVFHAAFGFLEWKEPNGTDSSFSPLALMPVKLEKKKTREGAEFWVSADGDEPETNVVLAEKMRLDFGIDLPRYEGGSIEDYLRDVATSAPSSLSWKVRRQVVFGVFPSARMAMYRDLDTSKRSFEENQVIAGLFGGTSTGAAAPFADEYEVDDPAVESKVPYLVMDANFIPVQHRR